MVINESGLTAAMKKAKNGVGYEVAVSGSLKPGQHGRVVLMGPGWMVDIAQQKVPKKVLSLIVEHLGILPEENKAYQVRKKTVQDEIFSVAVSPLVKQDAVTQESDGEPIRNCRLIFNGYSLWQCTQSMKVIMMDTDRLAICREAILVPNYVGGMMYLQGTESRVYLLPEYSVQEDASAQLNHLEQFKWVKMN